MMDEKQIYGLYPVESEKKSDSLYPMCFGVSCAFFALHILAKPEVEDKRWSKVCDKILQESAQLLGLLVWKVQRDGTDEAKCDLLRKLEIAEREIEELKRIRHEDAKANEKVVCIFAAQEQSRLTERKQLRQHIGALMNELRVLEKKKDEVISELNDKLKEMEIVVQSKDNELEGEKQKNRELEQVLKEAENVVEELREAAKQEAQEHSSELRKHKTAFIEVVSNQRQLEAEMSRTLRQVEALKQELDAVLGQKEEAVMMVQKLSIEMGKMHKDLEQKDKILSAMLRKSKLDATEKQMLLKEVKLSKAKRKQAELETERWRAVSESRHERHSLRSLLANHVNSKPNVHTGARGLHSSSTGSSHTGKMISLATDPVLEYGHLGLKKDRRETEFLSSLSDHYPLEGNEELPITSDVKRLEGWVHSEAKYATLIQQRHHLELDAFAEQMRVKDEKLEAFRWQLLSMELESKRLELQVEGLNDDISQLRLYNTKLEALLLEREEELAFLKEQLASQLMSQNSQKTNLSSSPRIPATTYDIICSEGKTFKGKTCERELETMTTNLVDRYQGEDAHREEETPPFSLSKDIVLVPQPHVKELEYDKNIHNEGPAQDGRNRPEDVDTSEKPLSETSNSPWRMDLHALGVSYKIKRLKQQLVMLERLTGKQEDFKDAESNNNGQFGINSFVLLMSSLNKQVGRYQSLQAKADDLCKRMHENDLNVNLGGSSTGRTRGETKALEHFLEETFQLQRYIVASGQKLMEIQPKIASGLVGIAEALSNISSSDMKCFADSVRTLFQEVQRGLEVRMSRVIGDLEGTLACEGMIHLRRN